MVISADRIRLYADFPGAGSTARSRIQSKLARRRDFDFCRRPAIPIGDQGILAPSLVMAKSLRTDIGGGHSTRQACVPCQRRRKPLSACINHAFMAPDSAVQ